MIVVGHPNKCISTDKWILMLWVCTLLYFLSSEFLQMEGQHFEWCKIRIFCSEESAAFLKQATCWLGKNWLSSHWFNLFHWNQQKDHKDHIFANEWEPPPLVVRIHVFFLLQPKDERYIVFTSHKFVWTYVLFAEKSNPSPKVFCKFKNKQRKQQFKGVVSTSPSMTIHWYSCCCCCWLFLFGL